MKKITLNIVSSTMLICLLALPVSELVHPFAPYVPVNENRVLEPFPAFSGNPKALAELFRKFERYFNDHFGFRNNLIYLNNIIQYQVFGVAANPRVAIGREGWLFLQDNVQDIKGEFPFKPGELEQWRDFLESRRRWLQQRGIAYRCVLCPAKNAIYPEYLPSYLERTGVASRMEALISAIKSVSPNEIVEVKPAVLEASRRHQTYFKKDLHWNSYGSFIAAQQVLGSLSPEFADLRPFHDDEFFIRTEPAVRYPDLAGLLSLQQHLGYDDDVDVRLVHEAASSNLLRLFVLPDTITRIYNSIESERKAVVFHDSFGSAPGGYLAERFGRVYAVESDAMSFIPAIVERESPDIVVDFILENKLATMKPQSAGRCYDEEANTFWKEEFEKGTTLHEVIYRAGSVLRQHSAIMTADFSADDRAQSYILHLSVDMLKEGLLILDVVNRERLHAARKTVLTRPVHSGINEIYVPVNGKGTVSSISFRTKRSNDLRQVRFQGARYRTLEVYDKSNIVPYLTNIDTDNWTHKAFSYFSGITFKQLTMKFWVHDRISPNKLTIRTDQGDQTIDLKAGSQEIMLPFSRMYRFELEKTFIPMQLGINEDKRDLGVQIESAVIR